MPISRNEQKLIRSLAYGKYRQRHKLFCAEGRKVVATIAERWQPFRVFATSDAASIEGIPFTEVDPKELHSVSFLQHPQDILALFPLPFLTPLPTGELTLTLVLDGIQDPGNLGTILRIADWFGISRIVCSNDTADAFSPKAVQASMGSVAHVDIAYTNLEEWLTGLEENIPIFTTALNGDSIYDLSLPARAVIIMGNEGNGVCNNVAKHATGSLTIPSYHPDERGAESLNVAMATAVICSEWQRQLHR